MAKWADSGAPRGNPADMPPPRDFETTDKWTIGEPDLVLRSKDVTVPAVGPDRWGDFGLVPTGLTEDRYVSAVEVREVNDIPKGGGDQYRRRALRVSPHDVFERGRRASAGRCGDEGGTSWPIHEVGRNADIFPPEAGRLLAANSALALTAGHLHSNGRETTGASRVRLQVLSEGLQAALPPLDPAPGQRHRHRREAESGEPGAPRVRHAAGAHQDHHLRAAPARAGRAHVPRGDLGPQHPDAQLRGIRPQLGQAVRLR